MAERSCLQAGKHAVFTQTEVNEDFWHGKFVDLHAVCYGPEYSHCRHPGLQVMMRDSTDPNGVRVIWVISTYAGEQAGLLPDDLIVSIDRAIQ